MSYSIYLKVNKSTEMLFTLKLHILELKWVKGIYLEIVLYCIYSLNSIKNGISIDTTK